ncbi:type 1 glutamine amidotransferase domain-containing protein [Haliea sp. E1-2-M8]|uniref:type 1 glutamine amidotransferase domain-containing protein n=1 Tax=Haliea sp. E1-2-M8 TaxID=3064706 RepID=UPI0027170417|nr:type 1 glutamine amidotransferase domain-containing protein [Haliea sp. E1-2-M8]MDO8861536.1 type 1 glutamine amidotransferase domain-containing protein [Haliea sp. E1-2-M8]
MSDSKKLAGKRVAILAADGFEQSELFKPRQALIDAGATVDVVSLASGSIKGWNSDNWGDSIAVDKVVTDVSASDYSALVLPGGLFNPDALRANKDAVNFVQGFFNEDSVKPVAAICHGPWVLVEAGVVKGRTMTSYPSIQTDLKNAGVNWVDEEVVVDNGLVTSRNPDDIPAFNRKMIEEFCEGRHTETA